MSGVKVGGQGRGGVKVGVKVGGGGQGRRSWAGSRLGSRMGMVKVNGVKGWGHGQGSRDGVRGQSGLVGGGGEV